MTDKKKLKKFFANSEHALERECLRVTKKGELARTPHPASLGSALMNPYITTDFAEQELELVTPVFRKERGALDFLCELHTFVYKNIGDELLWPSSMPCRLPKENKIQIAYYGTSNEGKKRTLYRQGLAQRYGKKMQTVAGIHYNFSFSKEFWDYFYKKSKTKLSRQDFISEKYFRIMRNFLRFGWLNVYLFGASPAIDKSYLGERPKALNKCGKCACYGEHATSLRMSDFGYNSKIQKQIAVSFNSLEEYVEDMEKAVTTPNPAYANLSPQINSNKLQIENEYYSPIRPKQPTQGKESVCEALENRGVKYLEIRAIDMDPFEKNGVGIEQLHFLHIMMVYCLFKQSRKISEHQKMELLAKWNFTAFYGRKERPKQAGKILKEMEEVAKLLGDEYLETLKKQQEKLKNPDLTPSARFIEKMRKNGKCFIKTSLEIAQKNKEYFRERKLRKEKNELFRQAAKKSIIDRENQEAHDEFILEGCEDMELSTQILIREAHKQGIKVELLDREDNFIRLTKGRKIEYIKQATQTSRDSLISYFLMKNKKVSKQVLKENGFSVPRDMTGPDKKIVVKPNSTNYGISIGVVEANDEKAFAKAVNEALTCDKTLIIEEFIEGREYRFLVIGDRTVSVLRRLPANVTGDNKHTIKELIDIKNNNPKNYKPRVYFIRMGKTEKEMLAKQGLTFKSILPKGRTVFLRKNSNVSTGGDPIDVTEKMHKSYKKIAQGAARVAKAKFCGVDMIVKNPQRKATKSNHSIIEINFNPAIQMHAFPMKGKKRNIGKHILKELGF